MSSDLPKPQPQVVNVYRRVMVIVNDSRGTGVGAKRASNRAYYIFALKLAPDSLQLTSNKYGLD
jgi:hypothetical protein